MVNAKLMQPQEVEVHYILPAIRRELAIAMKAKGFEQKRIAKLLNVTEPAVSQYIKNKRGADVEFPQKVMSVIDESEARIRDEGTLIIETQKLLRVINQEGITCKVHMKVAGLPKTCNVCYEEPNVIFK